MEVKKLIEERIAAGELTGAILLVKDADDIVHIEACGLNELEFLGLIESLKQAVLTRRLNRANRHE
jgi:hypothetical protein